MLFIVLLPALAALGFAAVIWWKKIGQLEDAQTRKRRSWATVAILSIAYWGWESVTGGNIRVDLLLIYPLLAAAYVFFLWDSMKWRAILTGVLLMALNVSYMIISYPLFDKARG